MSVSWVDFSLGAAATVTVIAFICTVGWRGIKGMARWFRKLNLFAEDFFGEPERPGVPRRPGLVERVTNTEEMLTRVVSMQEDTSKIVRLIWDETMPNHGSSQRDDIARIHEAVTGRKSPLYEAREKETAESKGMLF